MQKHEHTPVVERKFQRRRSEILAAGQVKAAVAAAAQQGFFLYGAIVAAQHLRLHKGHVVGVHRNVELFAKEVGTLRRYVLVAFPCFAQVFNFQQHTQRRVGFNPCAIVFGVIMFIQFCNKRKHAVGHILGQLAAHCVGEKVVEIGKRAVDDVAHSRYVDHEGLRALDDFALDDVDELKIPVFVDFVKNRHVRVQAVQSAAVARPVPDARAHGVIVNAVAQCAKTRRKESTGLDLAVALVEHDSGLLLAVGQQVNVRTTLAVFAGTVGGIACQHGTLSVAGAHYDQAFTKATQAVFLAYPSVQVALNKALPRHERHFIVIALGGRQKALDEVHGPGGLLFIEPPWVCGVFCSL